MPTAAAYFSSRTIREWDSPTERPGPGQVRLDVAYTGVCGTDLHIFHGDMDARVEVPAVLGHEMSGVVAQLGPGVDDWEVGDQVTVMPVDWCGHCPACLAGHQHLCHRLNFLGIDSPGAMQREWVVPARTLIRLPADLPLELGALVEPAAVACHDVRRAGLRDGEKVLVVGGGPIGLLIAQMAGRDGASVLLSEPESGRRKQANALGIAAVDPGGADLPARLNEWTEGAGVAVAFEVSGSGSGVSTAVAALATRGRLVLVAIHPRPQPVDLHRFFWRELTLTGVRLYEREDFARAVEEIATGGIQVRPLISHVLDLSRADEAFALLDSGSGAMKILVDCQGGGSSARQRASRAGR